RDWARSRQSHGTGAGKGPKTARATDSATAQHRTGPIIAADGKTRYPAVTVFVFETGRANKEVMIDVAVPMGAGASGTYRQRVGEGSALQFADRPGDAPILHFDGPLTMALE